MKIIRFNESKKTSKDKDGIEMPFDVESTIVDKDMPGFKSENEEITKAAEKNLKKKIQVTTPGLKKSIKKFEDFTISISVDEVAPEVGAINPNGGECCSGCDCNPCECENNESDDSGENITSFVDFLKSNM